MTITNTPTRIYLVYGIEPVRITDTSVTFVWKGSNVVFYPYSGWATGKTIKDGRGYDNLFKQLRTAGQQEGGGDE